MNKTMTAEQKLAEALAQIEQLKAAARVEAVKKAKYPWENPEMIQEQQRVGYNFRMEPETYLKIQWVLEHKGGLKSIQKLLEKATNKYLDGVIKELEGK